MPPTFLETNWLEGTIFSLEDDPDRCKESVSWPSLLKKVDPIKRKEELTVDKVYLPWISKDAYAYAVIVHNVLTTEECQQIIEMTNKKGYTPALLNIGRGNQMYAPEARNGWRVIIDDEEFTKFLFQVLKDVLPENDHAGGVISGLNERCRFLCYDRGQEFPAHCDGRFRRGYGDPREGDCSRITLQLYLNDVPEEAGGATTFLNPSNEEDRSPCQPKAGSILMFSQNLYHEGSKFVGIEGNDDIFKYTMRTEAMYTPKEYIEERQERHEEQEDGHEKETQGDTNAPASPISKQSISNPPPQPKKPRTRPKIFNLFS